MPRKGRFLEILVAHLEAFLGPKGILVRSPEEFYEEGKRVGEIDVTLRGNFGSSSIFVGLECRDRPKEGPQGIPWIRDVASKRKQFGIHKIIAVSSTGFKETAISLAEDLKVDLLVLEDVNNLNASDWFQTIMFTTTTTSVLIVGRPLIITIPTISTPTIELKPSTPFLKLPGTTELVAIKDYFKSKVDALSEDFEQSDAAEVDHTLTADEELIAVLDDQEYTVTDFTLPIRLQRDTIEAKALLNAYKKPTDDNIIALSGVSEIQLSNRKIKAVVLMKRNVVDDVILGGEMLVGFLGEDNKPDEMIKPVELNFYSSEGKLISSRKDLKKC